MKIKYPIGGFAPGYYSNKCVSCKEEFMGDKLARQCEPCAINTVNESNTKALAELHELKTVLEKIKFSNDAINEVLNWKVIEEYFNRHPEERSQQELKSNKTLKK